MITTHPMEAGKQNSAEEDDDVICIPALVPLVCIESTDNETDNEESISQQQIEKTVTANANAFHQIEDVSQAVSNGSAESIYDGSDSDLTNTSESECSSTQIHIKNRSKRMMKRKSSSSSNNTSDDDDGMFYWDILKDTSTPYLQQGEAIKNVKSDANKKRVEVCLNDISTISNHLEGKSLTSDDLSINKTNEDSSSIDARQVVEHVLEKSITVEVDSANQANIVEDQIGRADNCADISEPANVEQSTSLADISSVLPTSAAITSSEPNRTEKLTSWAVDPEIGWNDEMKRFYHNSWGGENFNVTVSQRPMTNRSGEWDVLADDKRERNHKNRSNDMRCNNCGERGHQIQECYIPPRQIKCHMCGQPGHREPRCPQTMCLRCGSPTSVYSHGCASCQHLPDKICPLCKTRGHGVRECPDKWRRYHSTIVPGQPLTKLPLIFNKTRYCCICAGKGHTAEYCPNALSFLDTPAPSMRIQSYCDIYDPIVLGNSEEPCKDVARFALISAPVENVQFSWDIDESPNRFYGRIMEAINISCSTNSQQINPKENVMASDLVKTSSALLMSSSCLDDSRSLRAAKSNKRIHDSQTSGPAEKVRKEQHRNKRKRSDIEGQLRDEDQTSKFLDNPQEQFVFSDEQNAITLMDSHTGSSLILKEPLLNDDDKLMETVRHCPKPKNTGKIKYNEFHQNIESFEPTHTHGASADKATVPAKRFCFDSNHYISMENHQSCEITKSLGNFRSSEDGTGLADNVSATQVDVHHDNEVLLNVISHQTDNGPSQLTVFETSTTDKALKQTAYKWRITPNSLPRTRLLLIQFIEGHLLLLQRSYGKVNELYEKMYVEEHVQKAALIRRKLNIVLLGQTGLRSGSTHLRLLQSNLKSLLSMKKEYVTLKLRMEVFRHYEYIFTPFVHDNYPGLLNEYNRRFELRDSSNLAVEGVAPPVPCDIDVRPVANANMESNSDAHLDLPTGSNLPDCIRSPFHGKDVSATVQHNLFMSKTIYRWLKSLPTFLPDTYAKYKLDVRVREFNFCVIFLVHGTALAQSNFFKDLIDFSNKVKILPDDLDGQLLIIFLKNEMKQFNLPCSGNTMRTASEHDDGLSIDWHCFGRLLIVEGTTNAQNNFRNQLLAYCQNETSRTKWVTKRKNRREIILIIMEKLKELTKSQQNTISASHGNARQLYDLMTVYESDMYNFHEADRVRVLLNVILMGQAGLRDGSFHLKMLRLNLKSLQTTTRKYVPRKIQNDFFTHYQYIFSPFRHDDYLGLINEYEDLQKKNTNLESIESPI